MSIAMTTTKTNMMHMLMYSELVDFFARASNMIVIMCTHMMPSTGWRLAHPSHHQFSHILGGRDDDIDAFPPGEDDGPGGDLENIFPGEFSKASNTRMTLLVSRSSSSTSSIIGRAGAWRGGLDIMTAAPLDAAAARETG